MQPQITTPTKKQQAEAAKAQRRDQYLRDRYNISLADFEKLLTDQDNACAICDTPRHLVKMVVDYSLEDECVMGVLCLRCLACVRALREFDARRGLEWSTRQYLKNVLEK